MGLKIEKKLKVEKGVKIALLQFSEKCDEFRKLNRKKKEENQDTFLRWN